ncbi:MAG: hypothetical protein NTX88_01255 [Candidatus Atribacteria bacterium]|nr:hypothetical protein [Candidatus Atribacteria bacterium]
MLQAENLKVSVDGEIILQDVNLPVGDGEVHILLGPSRSCGLTKEESLSLITRGFLDVDIPGIPPALKKYMEEIVKITSREVM